MSTFSSYDTTNSPSGPEKPRVFGLKVLNDVDLLRRNGLGDVPTLVAGYLQVFQDVSGRIYGKVVRADGTTVKEAMVGEYFLREDLDFDGRAATQFRVQDAPPLALGTTSDGILSRDPSNRRLIKNGPTGGKRHYLSEFDFDGGSYRRVKLAMQNLDVSARAYGSMLTTGGVTQAGITTTPVLLSTWDTDDEAKGVLPNNVADTLTAKLDGLYKVSSQLSVLSSVNKIYTFWLAVNGAATVPLVQAQGRSGADEWSSVTVTGFINLSENDTVSLFVSVDVGSANLTVRYGQIDVQRIGHVSVENHAAPGERDTSVQGLRLTNTTDGIYFVSTDPLPTDYTGGHDVLLELIVRLENAELATDTIDAKVTMEKASIGTEGFDGVTSVYTDTGVAIGAPGTAAGTFHRVLIPMPFNNVTNPLASDDLIRGLVQRNNLALVGEILVTSLNLLIPCYGGVDFQ